MNGTLNRSALWDAVFNRSNLMFIIGLLLCAYFSYHIMHGNRSLAKLHSLEIKITSAQAQASDLEAEQEVLKQKVTMMRPQTLDKDLLEERIRVVLGYTQNDDLVISYR